MGNKLDKMKMRCHVGLGERAIYSVRGAVFACETNIGDYRINNTQLTQSDKLEGKRVRRKRKNGSWIIGKKERKAMCQKY